MRSILLFVLVMFGQVAFSQEYATVPDSVDLIEADDEISIFKGELTFGKSQTRLYFGGSQLHQLQLHLKDGEAVLTPEGADKKKIDYLKFPEWTFQYGERIYDVIVELIMVDFPGNEINWRMVPRVHFQPAE